MPVSNQGVNLERYMLVPRTLIFITQGDNVLLLKGAEDKRLWSGLYNGIGGHIEQGEDIFTAAQRELFEETGLDSCELWLCGIAIVDTHTNPGVCVFIFKGSCSESSTIQSNEGFLEWINSSDINNLPLVPDLPVLLPKILQMKKGEPLFSALTEYVGNKIFVNIK